MPPRIPPHRLPQPIPCQCFRTRPALGAPSQSTRDFSTTSPNSTRLRRNMFAWLKGPGKAFRKPLPGSSNYLSAYDKQGQLLRVRQAERENQEQDDAELDESEDVIQAREREEGLSEAEVQQRMRQREKRRLERQKLEERGGIPKESARDLRPYPLNREFRSQPVLSEELREKIYEMVAERGMDLKSVSAAFGVDIRRVAAVVRLIGVEREWVRDGKSLAKPYNKAILAMLPQTPYRPSDPPPHEPINDLPVHPYTRPQIFIPTSESRPFTRADAAKVFHPSLLPADERIPHPELVQLTKWEKEGHDRETRKRLMREKDGEAARAREEKERRQAEWEKRNKVVVKGRRWDFAFQNISAERVGKDGRGRHAVGIRYGMPYEDRKKGMVKIPTKVE